MEVMHDHDYQRLHKQAIGIGFRSPALALGRGRWDGHAGNEFDQGDKQRVLSYHRGYLRVVTGVVTTMMRR
jgi:hypothetical protein